MAATASPPTMACLVRFQADRAVKACSAQRAVSGESTRERLHPSISAKPPAERDGSQRDETT